MLSPINATLAAARVAGQPEQLLDEWRTAEPGATVEFGEVLLVGEGARFDGTALSPTDASSAACTCANNCFIWPS